MMEDNVQDVFRHTWTFIPLETLEQEERARRMLALNKNILFCGIDSRFPSGRLSVQSLFYLGIAGMLGNQIIEWIRSGNGDMPFPYDEVGS